MYWLLRILAAKSRKTALPSLIISVLPFFASRIDAHEPKLKMVRYMSFINVEIWDATGNKRQQVELPADAPVNRIVAALVEKMRFPQNGPDGQLLSYKLQHRPTGKQLLESQTLASINAQAGDVFRLLPEITAG
jgi:hypothetical protein